MISKSYINYLLLNKNLQNILTYLKNYVKMKLEKLFFYKKMNIYI